MLVVEGFAHRAELAEIIRRWMVNRPKPGDVLALKKLVNFNLYVARIWVDDLARNLLSELHQVELRRHTLRTKGRLKDFIVENPTYTNARVEEMRMRYLKYPEDFYRDAPIDGAFFAVDVGPGFKFVGATRIKRMRRIAEKGSRRIVDFLLDRIRANADALADERAKQKGVPRAQLRTPPQEMADEFQHAERRVIKSIKKGTIHRDLPLLSIPDAVGMKIIDEDPDYTRLRAALAATDGCRIVESERHAGLYNAVNLRVELEFPRELLARYTPSGQYFEILRYRGLDPDKIPAMYQEFLATAEDTISVEIIVSTFQEFLESEIGRGMHEERVLSQRSHPDYNGNLATNIRYLMSYILELCRGPGPAEISEVPIKAWVKYMPDTVDHLIRGIHLDETMFFDAIAEPPQKIDAPVLPPAVRTTSRTNGKRSRQ